MLLSVIIGLSKLPIPCVPERFSTINCMVLRKVFMIGIIHTGEVEENGENGENDTRMMLKTKIL